MPLKHPLFFLLLLAGCVRAFAAPDRPNVLFILADDWGWGDLSCHGSEMARTPNLDRLAGESTEFAQFDVANPVCSPSRVAFMTGRFPARYAIHQHFDPGEWNRKVGQPDWLDPHTTLVTRLFKQAGYATGHFGKWHLTYGGALDAPLPSAYGIDEHAIWTGPRQAKQQPDNHKVFDDAIAFIRAHRAGPFYVNLWIKETHAAQTPTEESMKEMAHLDEQHRPYFAAVADGDKGIGRVLAVLRELKLEENTIVVFTSDNGPEHTGGPNQKKLRGGYGVYYSVGSTGGQKGGKRSLFEGGVHLPFLVRWPGHVPAGRQDKTTVLSSVDLLPTLCAAAGIASPAGYQSDGENMLPAWLGTEVSRTKPLYWEWGGLDGQPGTWPRRAVRVGEWKLVVGRDGRQELYRLPSDWSESDDVAKAHPDMVSRLSAELDAWIASLPKTPDPKCISQAAPKNKDRSAE